MITQSRNKKQEKIISMKKERQASFPKAVKTIVVLCICLMLYSCDKARVFEENKTIPDNVWNKDSIMKFEVVVTNTSAPNNFFINVRNADGFPYSNLYLFIKTIFPNGKIAKDTLNCILADEKGNWLGSGMGDIYDNQIPFKRNVHFPSIGKYVFEIQHGMPLDNVPLIMDVGLRIEKAE